MSQSLAQVWLHVIFSTKDRRTFLRDPDFREQMFKMLAHNVHENKCVVATVGGWDDHVHLLIGLSRTITIAKLVEHIKTETSKWAKDVDKGTGLFAWQAGYGAFSVSHSGAPRVVEYIKKQDERHAKITFQQEYRKICERHGVVIDERYAWD